MSALVQPEVARVAVTVLATGEELHYDAVKPHLQGISPGGAPHQLEAGLLLGVGTSVGTCLRAGLGMERLAAVSPLILRVGAVFLRFLAVSLTA